VGVRRGGKDKRGGGKSYQTFVINEGNNVTNMA